MFYGQSKIMGSLGPHYGIIMFLGTNGDLITRHGP